MRKPLGVLTALLLTTILTAPAVGALPIEWDPRRPPFPAAPTFVSLSDEWTARPNFIEPFGWDCVETRKWGPVFDQETRREAFAVEVACTPPPPPVTTVDEFTCRNPGVNVYGEGAGLVTGEYRCETIFGGCTAFVVVAGSCSQTTWASSRGPLLCYAEVTPGVTRWSVSCFNDP